MQTALHPEVAHPVDSGAMADSDVALLLTAAAHGDGAAWETLVDRYGRLVWSVVRSFGVDMATAADISQTVWLRLIEHSGGIRDPQRLPGWLATTAKREAIRVIGLQRRQQPSDAVLDTADRSIPPPDEALVDDELSRQVYEAFGHLSEGCQHLLRLLTAEPRLDYATIADMISRPVGSIGPTRARCLTHLRRYLEQANNPEATHE